MNTDYSSIRVLAFDADDTLWDNQSWFDEAERRYVEILAPFADEQTVREGLYATETGNMPILGYGTKAFTISLMEYALEIGGSRLDAARMKAILEAGKSIFSLPCTPLPGVRETLVRLKGNARVRLVLFTKGDPLDQRNKLERSGLAPLFEHIEIDADKTEQEYLALCRKLDVRPEDFAMVGNSFKSDILPVLHTGGTGFYLPFKTMWAHERAEECEHPRLVRLGAFSDLCAWF